MASQNNTAETFPSSTAEASQQDLDEQQRLREVEENYRLAKMYYPENFGRVTMLYVTVQVNDVDLVALVDSGAEQSNMAEEAAARCGLLRLMDIKYQGYAVGCGTQKILGRVHACPLEIQGMMYFAPVHILKSVGDYDMILGLEFFKRFKCTLDLRKNQLVIRAGPDPTCVEFMSPQDLRLYRESKRVDAKKLKEVLRDVQESAASPPANVSYHDVEVDKLMEDYGMSRQQATQLLIKADGNYQVALIHLLTSSLNLQLSTAESRNTGGQS